MADDDVSSTSFETFALFDDDIAVVISAEIADLEERVEQSQAHLWYDGSWSTTDLPQSCIAVRTWEHDQLMHVYYLSNDGIVLHDDGESDIEAEPIDETDDGPNEMVMMRDMRRKDNVLVAVGMARMAYEKVLPDGKWHRIDQGLYVPPDQITTSVGLNGLAFDNHGGILAVGYKGEIWYRDQGGVWASQASPTNVLLSAVAAHPEADELTIVGLQGLVLQGSPRTGWTVVQGAPQIDFWSVTYFKGQVYLGSDSGVFRLKNGVFEDVKVGGKKSVTTSFLESTAGAIWSMGDSHLFKSTNGTQWTALPSPV